MSAISLSQCDDVPMHSVVRSEEQSGGRGGGVRMERRGWSGEVVVSEELGCGVDYLNAFGILSP